MTFKEELRKLDQKYAKAGYTHYVNGIGNNRQVVTETPVIIPTKSVICRTSERVIPQSNERITCFDFKFRAYFHPNGSSIAHWAKPGVSFLQTPLVFEFKNQTEFNKHVTGNGITLNPKVKLKPPGIFRKLASRLFK